MKQKLCLFLHICHIALLGDELMKFMSDSDVSLKIIISVSSFFSFKYISDKNAQYFIKSTSFHLGITNTMLGSRYKYYPHFIVKETEVLEYWNCFPRTTVAWGTAGLLCTLEETLCGEGCPVSLCFLDLLSVLVISPLKWI